MTPWDMGMGLGVLNLIFNLLLIALVVGAVVLVVRSVSRPSAPVPGQSPAEQILAERFARGEIDTAEYDARLRTLRGELPTP